MKNFIYIIVAGLCVLSCQNVPSVTKPEKLIAKADMEEIMYQSVLVNAARGYNPSKLKLIGVSPETYIYEKFDIDSTMYAQSLAYYTGDVDVFKEMNSSVLKRIEQKFAVDDSLESAERKLKDSLRNKRSREILEENKMLDSLKNKKMIMPARTVTDSFTKRSKEVIIVTESM